ncbi:MAG: O-antigen ligase family protein [Bacteroidales bacterium]|nr:O-antigen ligase family protein [Bacteroidales bacterium]
MAINYGLVGALLLLAAGWFIRKSYLRCKNTIPARIAAGSLLSIAVFACFSYPLTYPFVWVMGFLSAAIIVYRAGYRIKIAPPVWAAARIALIPAVAVFGLLACRRMADEMKWCEVAHKSLSGQTEQMLPTYRQLHQSLSKNELFLYNYAAELNVVQRYDESLQVAKECERLWADYDLQMLMADNCRQMKLCTEAEQYYKKAAAMCPAKFMPLYKLAKLHEEQGDKAEARKLAALILEKRVKVPSATIIAIKREMRQLVESEEGDAPAPEGRTDAKPVNKIQSRQDTLLEPHTPKGLLPP